MYGIVASCMHIPYTPLRLPKAGNNYSIDGLGVWSISQRHTAEDLVLHSQTSRLECRGVNTRRDRPQSSDDRLQSSESLCQVSFGDVFVYSVWHTKGELGNQL